MSLQKRFDINEKVRIYYSIRDDGVDIDKFDDNLEEQFHLHIYPNQKISFGYTKNVHFSIIRRNLIIRKEKVENPLSDRYTYEKVRDYLLDESKSDKQKIDFINSLLYLFLIEYNNENSWEFGSW